MEVKHEPRRTLDCGPGCRPDPGPDWRHRAYRVATEASQGLLDLRDSRTPMAQSEANEVLVGLDTLRFRPAFFALPSPARRNTPNTRGAGCGHRRKVVNNHRASGMLGCRQSRMRAEHARCSCTGNWQRRSLATTHRAGCGPSCGTLAPACVDRRQDCWRRRRAISSIETVFS